MEPEYLHFRGYRTDEPYILWRVVKATAIANNVSVVGFINGLPASPDAHNALRALLLFNRLDPQPDAVILMRDSDGDLDRRTGLHQARDAEPWPFPVVIGFAHTKRECWHICGYEPENDDERQLLTETGSDVGFDVLRRSDELTAKHSSTTDKRSAKRVLSKLCGDDQDRMLRCLTAVPISKLKERGVNNGLTHFLEQLETLLVPLFTPRTG
jgi:hypothetical protein